MIGAVNHAFCDDARASWAQGLLGASHCLRDVHHRVAEDPQVLPTPRRRCVERYKSLRTLSKRYGINPKTVAKWKKRTSVADLPTGPKEPHSTVSRWKTKRSSSPSASTRCCRWTTAFMRYSQPSRIHCPASNCTANAEISSRCRARFLASARTGRNMRTASEFGCAGSPTESTAVA